MLQSWDQNTLGQRQSRQMADPIDRRLFMEFTQLLHQVGERLGFGRRQQGKGNSECEL